MLRIGLAFVAALTATAATTPQVSVAEGDWSNIPQIMTSGSLRISDESIEQIEAAATGECAQPGQSKRNIGLIIPFMVKFSTTGAVEHVVVRNMNCPAIEQAAGGSVLQMARKGGYRPTGENLVGWYRGTITISSH